MNKINFKEKINGLKETYDRTVKKIKNNIKSGELKKINKKNLKYYSVLVLMILLSILTTYVNIKSYQEASSENFVKYELKDNENEKALEVISTDTVDDKNVGGTPTEQVKKYNVSESSIMTLNPKDSCIYPLDGNIIREYSADKVIYYDGLGVWKNHCGIDITSNNCVNVNSVSDGIVIAVYKDSAYGNCVEITDDKYTYIYKSLEIVKYKVGDSVKRGEKIGETGYCISEGELGKHVHFEIKKDNVMLNPEILMTK